MTAGVRHSLDTDQAAKEGLKQRLAWRNAMMMRRERRLYRQRKKEQDRKQELARQAALRSRCARKQKRTKTRSRSVSYKDSTDLISLSSEEDTASYHSSHCSQWTQLDEYFDKIEVKT